MAIITFMSDFGHRDHYVAAVKAKIYSINPNINIVDVTHEIERFNIPHAAYVLKSIYKDFPKGTVHLVSINAPNNAQDKLLAVKFEEHYFVGVDNGLFSLLSDKPLMPVAVELNRDHMANIFPERTVLANAAVSLASGMQIYNLGIQVPAMKQMLNRQVRISKNTLAGQVIHVDSYGNLITNISNELFTKVADNRSFEIIFGRETLDKISSTYDITDHGDILAVFNSNNLLEFAISLGNASELLGLSYDSPIRINFFPELT
ncbi:MAG: hypothetical protein EAZ07_07300 [Cytophagales bacterium]|nr:MAG: hypothetical protein EAZ07_07300 [Cytophagales bacterium]